MIFCMPRLTTGKAVLFCVCHGCSGKFAVVYVLVCVHVFVCYIRSPPKKLAKLYNQISGNNIITSSPAPSLSAPEPLSADSMA